MSEYKLVTITVPSVCNDGRIADLAPVRARLLQTFRGFTETTGTGWWADDDGALVQEPVSIFHIAVSVFGGISAVRTELRWIAETYKQKSVYHTIDGHPHFYTLREIT